MYEQDGAWSCDLCKRTVKPGKTPPQSIMSEITPSHGLVRKEMLASDAYQPEPVEFPYEAGQD